MFLSDVMLLLVGNNKHITSDKNQRTFIHPILDTLVVKKDIYHEKSVKHCINHWVEIICSCLVSCCAPHTKPNKSR